MMNMIKLTEVENSVIEIAGQKVILDSDVASLYEVETKRVNEAVKNNPDKFPEGYVLTLENNEWDVLRSKISTLKTRGRGEHTKYAPKAFTEKGLYMLATILKSPKATQTTLAIIEAFAKFRELSRTMTELADANDETRRKSLMQRSGELLADLLDNELHTSDTETTLEVNLAVLKLKHTVRKKKNDD